MMSIVAGAFGFEDYTSWTKMNNEIRSNNVTVEMIVSAGFTRCLGYTGTTGLGHPNLRSRNLGQHQL